MSPPPSLSDLGRPELETLLIELFGKIAALERIVGEQREEIALQEADRDPGSCPVSIFSAPEDGDTLKRYRDVGIARVTPSLPAAKEDVVLPILDRWAALIRQTAA